MDLCAAGDNQAAGRTLTVRRTVAPSLASMSISASVLNKSIRPRGRSLTRGWVTPIILAAILYLRRRDAMSFCTCIMRSARTNRCSASSRRNPRSRNTFPLEGVIFSFLELIIYFVHNETFNFIYPSRSFPCEGGGPLPRPPFPLQISRRVGTLGQSLRGLRISFGHRHNEHQSILHHNQQFISTFHTHCLPSFFWNDDLVLAAEYLNSQGDTSWSGFTYNGT